jgi:hypothetical protein
MVVHRQEAFGRFAQLSEFELNPTHELSAIAGNNAKILLCGHYINIVNQTGCRQNQPFFKQWEFGDDVTVYGENVPSPREIHVDR